MCALGDYARVPTLKDFCEKKTINQRHVINWTKTKADQPLKSLFLPSTLGNFHIILRLKDVCFIRSQALSLNGIFVFKLPITVRTKVSA